MKPILKATIATAVLGLMVACKGNVSQESFNKVQSGMTTDEVTKILGRPTNTSSANLLGVSGSTATWESGDAVITIQFVNDKVTAKSFSKGKQ